MLCNVPKLTTFKSTSTAPSSAPAADEQQEKKEKEKNHLYATSRNVFISPNAIFITLDGIRQLIYASFIYNADRWECALTKILTLIRMEPNYTKIYIATSVLLRGKGGVKIGCCGNADEKLFSLNRFNVNESSKYMLIFLSKPILDADRVLDDIQNLYAEYYHLYNDTFHLTNSQLMMLMSNLSKIYYTFPVIEKVLLKKN